jgi:GTPase
MTTTRCGEISVVGAPNAGKSSLINALVGSKVAIVSAKVQTTRTRLLGVAIAGDAQLLLVDTPGIFQPKKRLERAMVKAAWSAAGESELIVLVVDAKRGISADVQRILDGLEGNATPVVLVLNKVDITPKPILLTLTARLNDARAFAAIFMVSAETGSGIADLKADLAARMPEGPWHFDADQVSNVTSRMMATELTREKLFRQLHEELPYAAMVEAEKWETRRDGSAAIHQLIHVERDTHKAIVLGHKGARIKQIGSEARADMEAAFGHRVHLFLHVKVTPGWSEDRSYYKDQGLDWVE